MILITGGLGFLGSHMAAMLLSQGHEVILVDNLSHSRMEVLERLEYMAGRYVTFFRLDIRNTPALQKIFDQYAVSGVIHCAGMKSTLDSVMQPLDYYNDNVGGTMSLLRVMQRSGVKTLVYSSSLAVYGNQTDDSALTEESLINPETPYANSTVMCEEILHDLFTAEPDWRIAILRHGNIAGAHPSGIIGEWPTGVPGNLMPSLAQVAKDERGALEIPVREEGKVDSSGIRDYVHVMDVAEAHMYVLGWLFNQPQALEVFNIARGEGVTVPEVVKSFEAATSKEIATETVAEREGEAATIVADIRHIQELLKWTPSRTLDDMATDMWRFYQSL